ncbi:MAG: VOC family protein [Acidimicrobiia bacterium]|nr:VOC family protein [Acidimicrobiia bacterium]
MVQAKRVFGSFSVDDIDAADRFYREVLGMKTELVTDDGPLFVHGPNGTTTLIYPKEDHSPASFTVLNVSVADIQTAVQELTERGVEFQRYPGVEADEQGIHRSNGHSIAWFNDPAGNGLTIVQES